MEMKTEFWMHSKDEFLKNGVLKFFGGEDLDEREIKRIGKYICSWAEAFKAPPKVINECESIETRRDIQTVMGMLLDHAIDPF